MVQAQTTLRTTGACVTNTSLPLRGNHLHTLLRTPLRQGLPHLATMPTGTQCSASNHDCYGFRNSTLIPWGHPDFLVWHVSPAHFHDLASCLLCSYKPESLPATHPIGGVFAPASGGRISTSGSSLKCSCPRNIHLLALHVPSLWFWLSAPRSLLAPNCCFSFQAPRNPGWVRGILGSVTLECT